MPGHPTGGGVARLHHAVVDGVGEDKRAGAPPLESKSRCKGELRLPGLVVGHLRARAVAKENSDPGLVVGHLRARAVAKENSDSQGWLLVT